MLNMASTLQAETVGFEKIKDKRLIKKGELPIKVYEARNSLLEDLFQRNEHIKSAHYLGAAIFLGTIVSTAATDYAKYGRIYLGFPTIYHAFRNFPSAMVVWFFLFLSSISVYFGVVIWKLGRQQFHTLKKTWDFIWLALLVVYYPSLLVFSAKKAISYDLGIASSLTVTMEATRFLMKVHAFVRSNCPKCIKGTKDLYPTFSHYLYFSFSPALVYKETYPRSTDPIRWRYFIKYLLQFIGGIIFYSIVFEKMIIFRLNDYGIVTYDWKSVMAITLENFHYGLVLGLTFFYVGLHTYLNVTSELLRFSDRLFYKDWWTAETPDQYLRRWNVFVHDWLYTYVYKDFYENVFRGNKLISKFAVFLTSAVIHDFIVCVAGRLFIPITTILFLLPIIASQSFPISKQAYGVVSWISFGLCISINFTILSIEYFARLNCPLEEKSFFDYVKPRFLYC